MKNLKYIFAICFLLFAGFSANAQSQDPFEGNYYFLEKANDQYDIYRIQFDNGNYTGDNLEVKTDGTGEVVTPLMNLVVDVPNNAVTFTVNGATKNGTFILGNDNQYDLMIDGVRYTRQ